MRTQLSSFQIIKDTQLTLRRLESGKEIPYTLCRLSRSAFPLQYDAEAYVYTSNLSI